MLLSAAILNVSVLDVWLHGGWLKVANVTLFGHAWTARLVLCVLLAALVIWPAMRWLQALLAAAFVALIAFSGHASATPGFAGGIHLAADMAHLIAAAAWLGALPALALLLFVAGRRKEAAWDAIAIDATGRFSWVGIACVATLLASGIVASFILLASPRDLIATSYGRLLSLKIALFLTMVAFAAVNRFRLTPRLPRSIGTLVRTSLAEIVLGLGVIAAVALLGTMEPGGHVHIAPAEIPADAAFVHLHMPEVMADVTIDPGHPGRAHAIIHVMREDASDFPTNDVRFALDPPKAPTQSAPHIATHMPDGTWRVDNLDLRGPGVWTIRVIVATGAPAPAILDGPIVIAR
jgi:putative copper resistance protein D